MNKKQYQHALEYEKEKRYFSQKRIFKTALVGLIAGLSLGVYNIIDNKIKINKEKNNLEITNGSYKEINKRHRNLNGVVLLITGASIFYAISGTTLIGIKSHKKIKSLEKQLTQTNL